MVLALLWAGLLALGHWRWQRRSAALLAELAAQRQPLPPATHDPAQLVGLPAPVQRFFRAALTPGQPRVAGLTLSHSGSFNMGAETDSWRPFTSTQQVETARPGFLWNATIHMAPGLPVQVHDAYVGGAGVLMPALLGLFPLADLRGPGAIAEGELMRYLAEAAWYPTALLPGQGVTWTAIDDTSARASLTDGSVTVSLTFHFGPDGLIQGVCADARDRTVGKALIPTPWEGTWSDYQRRDGMMVPMAGEVAWILPAGRKPYWRGRITALAYRWRD